MKRAAAALSDSFIPGLTSRYMFDAINAIGCAYTMSRIPSPEQGVYLLSVSDIRKETHTVKFTMKYPKLEDFSDLTCTCTCAEFKLHVQWGTYCDHVICALEEVIDPEAEKHTKIDWGDWSDSPKENSNPVKRHRVKRMLESAKPEDVVKRLLAMIDDDDDKGDAVNLLAKLFPEEEEDAVTESL